MKQTIWREAKPFVGLAIVLVLYAIVRAWFAAAAGSRGLLEPNGALAGGHAALALALYVLRFAALFVVPWIAVYRLVMRAFTAYSNRSRARPE